MRGYDRTRWMPARRGNAGARARQPIPRKGILFHADHAALASLTHVCASGVRVSCLRSLRSRAYLPALRVLACPRGGMGAEAFACLRTLRVGLPVRVGAGLLACLLACLSASLLRLLCFGWFFACFNCWYSDLTWYCHFLIRIDISVSSLLQLADMDVGQSLSP